MAKEILSIPEEYLLQFIEIIQFGLDSLTDEIDSELKEYLLNWCKEEQKYIKGF